MHSRSRTDAFILSECLCSPFGRDFAEFKPLYFLRHLRDRGSLAAVESIIHKRMVTFFLLPCVMKAVNCTVIVVAAYTSVLACILRLHHFQISVLNTVTAFSKQPVPLVSWSAVDRLAEVQQGPGLVSDDEMGKISSGDRYSIKLMLTDWGLLLQEWRDACMHRYVHIHTQTFTCNFHSLPRKHTSTHTVLGLSHIHSLWASCSLRTSTVSLFSVSQRLGCSDEEPHSPLTVKKKKEKVCQLKVF